RGSGRDEKGTPPPSPARSDAGTHRRMSPVVSQRLIRDLLRPGVPKTRRTSRFVARESLELRLGTGITVPCGAGLIPRASGTLFRIVCEPTPGQHQTSFAAPSAS